VIILDTNVVSELMKPAPAASVVRWVARQPATSLYTTSITEAAILHGVMLLPAGKRRNNLQAAAEAMFSEDFARRVLPFGSDAARAYAAIAALRRRAGKPISHFDAQIAAIGRSARASVATRNTADFEECGITLINPWVDAERRSSGL
jgi:predicted nucleic acid-binding protein